MKQILFFIFLLNILVCPNLKAQFSPTIFIGNEQEDFTAQILTADFNNDGINDILTVNADFPLDNVKIYFQEAGQNFLPVLIDGQDNITGIGTGDLNDDGWVDFAMISGNGSSANLAWYENQNGSFERHFMANVNIGINNNVILKDFNNDGMTDILSLEHTFFVLRKAITPGIFSEGESFAEPTEYYAMDAKDYNNDGFLDVSVASATGFLVFLNDSGNSFSHFSNAGSFISFGLQSADLDLDGDIDIVSYDTLRGLNLYKNDGNGNFTFDSTVLDSTDDFTIFGLTDLNCDEIPDLHTVISQLGQVIWMENQGDGNFNSPNILHDFDGLIYASGNGDLNGDEIPDLIFGRNDLAMALNECGEMNTSALNQIQFQVYPNPVGNEINIISESNLENYTIRLIDFTGKNIPVKLNEGKVKMNSLSKGIYILNIRNEKGEILHSEKLLKK